MHWSRTLTPPRRWSSLAAAIALHVSGCATSSAAPSLSGAERGHTTRAEENERTFGVRIESLRMTAADHMLDLRYRVVDPSRAAEVVNERLQPRLLVPATGRVLTPPTTPKVGALRQAPSTLEKGRVYFALFGNTDGVKAGDTVRVVLGPLEQDVAVE